MANMMQAKSACSARMTAGERRLYDRLSEKLEDDYLVWYDVPVGQRRLQPDFVILHPKRGLLVLEVKDWTLSTLHALDLDSAQLRTERGLVSRPNPLRQARSAAIEIVDVLKRDPALIHAPGTPHAGGLLMPWGHGVVLSAITRADFESAQLGQVIAEHLVICRDEMTDTAEAEQFQKRLWDMMPYAFSTTLTLPQIDRVRWHMFPEIRVQPPSQADWLAPPSTQIMDHIPDIVRVMDLQQEQLARSLGDGHRVIHGVAGSGKTMILAYRCLHLASSFDKPVLVLCFNRTLAARLRQLVLRQTSSRRVQVRSFHSWCADMLRSYHVSVPTSHGDANIYFTEQVDAVINAVDRGNIPRSQYGAILVDEGHDFEPRWLELVVRMLDPATNALLLLYDDAQAIYARRRRTTSFASLGIEARGRTTILRLNYRNTWEVLAVAKNFASELLQSNGGDGDTPMLIAPESVGRHGLPPRMLSFSCRQEEATAIARDIATAREGGLELDQVAIIWRHQRDGDIVAEALRSVGIPFSFARDSQSKDKLFDDSGSVKLVSMHSSKGLEFARVYIPGIDRIPVDESAQADEARLLYVAMTRCTQDLMMSRTGNGGFVERVKEALSRVAA